MRKRTQHSLAMATALCAFGLMPSNASAQCLSERFSSSNGESGDRFGRVLAVSGDDLLVSASYNEVSGNARAGSVYRFERSSTGWIEAEEWTALDGSAADYFGTDVAISGDWAIVGCYWCDEIDTNAGAAYVYHRVGNSWSFFQKLAPAELRAFDQMGDSVDIQDGPTPRLVIGSRFHGAAGSGENLGGSAFVFEYDSNAATWNKAQVLFGDNNNDAHFYGSAVSMEGSRLVVGDSGDDQAASGAGALYVYDHDGTEYVETQKVYAGTPSSFAALGGAVKLEGDTIAAISNRGHIFELINGLWTETAEVLPAGETNYGAEIDIEGDLLAISEAGNGFGGTATYFQRVAGTWNELGTTTEFHVADFYGRDVILDQGSALVGAESANVNSPIGLPAGEVYEYPLVASDCNNNGISDACDLYVGTSADANTNGLPDECEVQQNYCQSTPNSSGSAATIGLTGSLSVSANNFTLTAGPVPMSPGIFFYGSQQNNLPFGNGTLCISPPLARLPIVLPNAGTASFTYDLSSPPNPNAQVTAGSTWNFQFWFRDTQVGAGFDLSDGLTVPFLP